MHVTWDPEDGSGPTEFEFDPEDLLSKEAVRIEKEYGEPIEQFVNGLRIKEARARRILLWWHMSQAHPSLAFRDVPDFRMRQLKCEMNVAELQVLKDRLARTKMDDEQRERLDAAFEVDMRDAMEREGLLEGDLVGSDVVLPKQA